MSGAPAQVATARGNGPRLAFVVGPRRPYVGASAIWRYDPATDSLVMVAGHDTARFGDLGIIPTLTKDEESSGAIDITGILGRNDGYLYTLLDVQNHAVSTDSTLQEGGQLLLMSTHVPDGGGAVGWLGVVVLADLARRRRFEIDGIGGARFGRGQRERDFRLHGRKRRA